MSCKPGASKTQARGELLTFFAVLRHTQKRFFPEGNSMNKLLVSMLLVLGFVGTGVAVAEQTDSTSPSYDMKAQALLDMERVQKKFVDLANAVPADKFGWRPSPDTRSFAEVLMHVAGERYQILGLMGAKAPDAFDGKTFEKSKADKAEVIAELDKTWEFTKQTIAGMSNADFAK